MIKLLLGSHGRKLVIDEDSLKADIDYTEAKREEITPVAHNLYNWRKDGRRGYPTLFAAS
jgi:hypothetical protein